MSVNLQLWKIINENADNDGYQDGEDATITLNCAGTLEFTFFDTEDGYDFVNLPDGTSLSGYGDTNSV